jgi:predicted MFS family arabinose efflux permease
MEEEAANRKVVADKSYWKAIRNASFVFITLGFFCRTMGNYGIQMWVPTIMKGISGFDDRIIGFILVIPWLIATGGMVLTGWINDRWNCKKALIFIEQIMSGLAYFALYFFGDVNVWLSVGMLAVAVTGTASVSSVYFSLLAQLTPRDMAGGLTGIFAALGNIGGFVGPFAVGFFMHGGNHLAGIAFLAGILFVGSLCISLVKTRVEELPVVADALGTNRTN